MVPRATAPTKGKEMENDESNIGELWMDLAEDGSQDGTSSHTEKDTSVILRAPTDTEASITPPAPSENEARMNSSES